MRRFATWGWGILASAALTFGCGDGGSIPTGEPGGNPSTGTPTTTSGTPSTTPGQTASSLWPLTTGSTWTYRITDDINGIFDKRVEVKGVQEIPEGGGQGILVSNDEPTLSELSWQREADGIVVRIREEDRRNADLLRVSTWAPGTVKAVSVSQVEGWVHSATVHELIRDSTGGTLEDRDKTYVWRVVGVNVTVSTPAGTFQNALKVERDRPDKTGKLRTYWLVPGIGKVREEGERLEELVTFDVK
jgi:hypothetical protein